MDYDTIKIYGTRVKVDSMEKVAEIEAAERLKMKEKVDKILGSNALTATLQVGLGLAFSRNWKGGTMKT